MRVYPGYAAQRRAGGLLDSYKGHLSKTRGVMDQDKVTDFTPFRTFYRLKVTRFPDGGGEAVCFTESVYQENAAELAAKAKRLANGGGALWNRKKTDLTESERAAKDKDNAEKTARRAAKAVRLMVRRLGADHLLTLTYRENMQDFERAKADWKEFVRRVQVRFPEWRYVVTVERQKRGAYHFHAAVVGRQNVKVLRGIWWRIVGEGQGNVDVQEQPKRWGGEGSAWSCAKLAGYLTKYMAKNFDQVAAGAKRYWASRNVAKARISSWYLDAVDMCDAIRQTYSVVASGRAFDVSHWLRAGGGVYWVASARPPVCPF